MIGPRAQSPTHFTILFWGFGTKTNEDKEKEGELIIMGQGPNCLTYFFLEFRVWGLEFGV